MAFGGIGTIGIVAGLLAATTTALLFAEQGTELRSCQASSDAEVRAAAAESDVGVLGT